MPEVIPVLFITICLPLWIIFHYITKMKMSKGLSPEDEKMLSEVWESTNKMEDRINTLERIVSVFANPDNTRLLIFSLIIGALLAYIRVSGGVAATVVAIVNKGIARNGKQASLMTSAVGAVIFVESNLSVLTSGILSRGLFDKYGLSRAKLAYIIDSTSAPICILILLNGWGAFVLALLGQYQFEVSAAEAVLAAL